MEICSFPFKSVPIFDRKKIGYEKFCYNSEDRGEYIRVFRLRTETAAASRDTFYVEYGGELYKWKIGDPEWTGTGLVDDDYPDNGKFGFGEGFKLAVLGETVYVGKRKGKLFQSLDEAESWKDITSSLPLHVTRFKDMIFVGATLYVATDNGVMASRTAEHWHVLTDSAGTRPIINNFAVDGSKVYGIGDGGVYRLDARNRWKQVSTEVPDGFISPAITNDRLYGIVERRGSIVERHGIFHTSLVSEEQ